MLVTTYEGSIGIAFAQQQQQDQVRVRVNSDLVTSSVTTRDRSGNQKTSPYERCNFAATKVSIPRCLRGRAWIAIDNAQVLHMEINLMHVIPAYKLKSAGIAIDYGPVQIHSRKMDLWLPQNIETYWEYEGYRLQHALTNFQVFSVDTQEKVKLPSTN
jgi:hypothetical protein